MKKTRFSVIAMAVISIMALAGCDLLFGPHPKIELFNVEGFSHGVTIGVESGKTLTLNIRGKISGGETGTLDILTDETVVATREVDNDFDIQWTVKFTDGGSFRLKARLTTENGLEDTSSELSLNVFVVSVKGISSDSHVIAVPDGAVQIYAMLNPGNATNRNITYTSNNPSVVAVEDGKLVAKSSGIADVTVTTEDGDFTTTSKVLVANTAGETPVTLFSSTFAQNTITLGNWDQWKFFVFAVTETTAAVNISSDTAVNNLLYQVGPRNSTHTSSGTIPVWNATTKAAENLSPGFYHLAIRHNESAAAGKSIKLYLYK